MNRWMNLAVIICLVLSFNLAGFSQAQDSPPSADVPPPADAPPLAEKSPPADVTQPIEAADDAAPGATATQPTTQPDAPPDPLSSPASMVEEFLLAVEESEKTPARLNDAVRCLDLSELCPEHDPAAVTQQGLKLAEKLERIFDALVHKHGCDRGKIPKQTKENIVFFPDEPKDGAPQLELVRGEDNLWRFSAKTVAGISEIADSIASPPPTPPPPAPSGSDVPPEFQTPLATMTTYEKAMKAGDKATARECFDLSDISDAVRAEHGTELAENMKFVMVRIKPVVLMDIPKEPIGPPYTWHVEEIGRIELERQTSGDKEGYWLFNKATVNSIPPLYDRYSKESPIDGDGGESFFRNPRLWILNKIPAYLKIETLGLQRWEWLGIIFSLVLSYVVYRKTPRISHAIARKYKLLEKAATLPAYFIWPLSVCLIMLVWWVLIWLMGVSTIPPGAWLLFKVVMIFAGGWTLYWLSAFVFRILENRAAKTAVRWDDLIMPLLRGVCQTIVIIGGVILILYVCGLSEYYLNKVFALVGLGGLAFSLAAKDTVANLFGSLTVVLDRPFQVGDWVKIGSAEGTVESVGLRSSRIRTFYNSQVTIPNADLMTATVDNMGRRQYRRISCKLAVTYATTPEQLEAFCEGIRELIRRHPFTRKDYYLVWVSEFADSAINIMLYCFHETADWTTEMRERHRLFLDIMRLARQLGVEFAFPTQTIHLVKEDMDAAGPSKVDVIAHSTSTKTTAEALEQGRSTAEKIAKASIGNPDDIPPRFEFPKVE